MDTTKPSTNLNELLLAFDQMIDADPNWGWDRPATLLDIVWVGSSMLQFRIREMFTGDVAEELAMRHPIKTSHFGVVLLCEGWRHSEEMMKRAAAGEDLPIPSECPDSTEMRVITMLLRNGETGAAVRDRSGGEPTVSTERLMGRVPEALYRAVRFV
jgi:hypothetical protein